MPAAATPTPAASPAGETAAEALLGTGASSLASGCRLTFVVLFLRRFLGVAFARGLLGASGSEGFERSFARFGAWRFLCDGVAELASLSSSSPNGTSFFELFAAVRFLRLAAAPSTFRAVFLTDLRTAGLDWDGCCSIKPTSEGRLALSSAHWLHCWHLHNLHKR